MSTDDEQDVDDRWDDLCPHAEGGEFWGVFNADDECVDPFAIFSTEQEAHDWVAFHRREQESKPDWDGAWLGGDVAVMVIRGLRGKAWNSYDKVPSLPDAKPAQERGEPFTLAEARRVCDGLEPFLPPYQREIVKWLLEKCEKRAPRCQAKVGILEPPMRRQLPRGHYGMHAAGRVEARAPEANVSELGGES
jgi:hypothetical protein